MKLLTLNTHSLLEENYAQKLKEFTAAILSETPDVIALQEVNQRQDARPIPKDWLEGYVPCVPSAMIREGNHLHRVTQGLLEGGQQYHWTWLPIKRGYGRYDEGVAVLSRAPIEKTDTVPISRAEDYNNWKTRKLLGIRIGDTWFYSVHLGWWDDSEDPFSDQWQKTNAHMQDKGQVFLMGDFNNPAEKCGEGYDQILGDGWIDTYSTAVRKDDGITVSGRIAGWTHRELPAEGARVDHIFCNRPCKVLSSQVIFNGQNRAVVSDHFGVMVEVKEK